MSSSVLVGCEALRGSGGAIWADAFHSLPLPSTSSSISLSSSRFSDCKSALNGGALFMSGGTLKLGTSTFDNNFAGGVVGGGGLCLNDVDADMYGPCTLLLICIIVQQMYSISLLTRSLPCRLFDIEDVSGQVARNNSAPHGGGGVIMWSGRTPRIAVLCAAGYEGAWSSCEPCEIGKYKNSTGTYSCLACEAGSFAVDTAQSSCAKCGIGKYSNNTGATSSSVCFNCPRDTSTLVTGAPSSGYCVCEPGFVAGLNGENDCLQMISAVKAWD